MIADAGGAVGTSEAATAREGGRREEATYEAAKWSAINRTEWPLFLWAERGTCTQERVSTGLS